MGTISEFLGRDHRYCDDLLVQAERGVEKGQWEAAQDSFRLFDEAMRRHMAMEENALFPAFENATGLVAGPTKVMREEHRQIRALLRDVGSMLGRSDANGFAGQLESLNLFLQQHNIKEESMLYPMSDRALSSKCGEIIDAMQKIASVGASCESEAGAHAPEAISS